jgi:Leucine-rich repeat (LRR) protein
MELGHRTQIKQLEQGLARNSYLKEVVKEHTQILTLKCRQGGNSHWISLFEQLPNIKQLYLRDFLALSVNKISQALVTLPLLQHLDFQYCELVTTPAEYEEYGIDKAKEEQDKQILYNLKELNFMWTDFSTEAIRQLFKMTPNLTRVNLGANHNRKPLANDSALGAMTGSCLHIKDLSISLQQVKQVSMCKMIQEIGCNLERLSVRCEGNETIKSIASMQKLQHLVIRCSNSNQNYNQDMMHILEQCHALTHLEMVSWPLQDVPSVVLEQLQYKASTAIVSPLSNYIEGIKRTVALDRQDLQEIRRLCLY